MLLQNTHNAVKHVTDILSTALAAHASDIHFDPLPTHCRVRMRIHGLITEMDALSLSDYQAIRTRIKTLSQLDIAQQRLPQDGRLHFFHDAFDVQFRVHCCACVHGEKLILRLITSAETCLSIEQLGLLENQYRDLLTALKQTHGMILICGPTGSGKTTTLYALLQYLQQQALQIITLEDPVEIAFDNLSQLQVSPKQGLGFAALLRAVLRQDPDVIMVGEMRDEETAHIAVRAALTGHLVLTTLHTPTAKAAITRLSNMGVAKYDLDECLKLVMAQRLVRVKQDGKVSRTGLYECYRPGHAYQNLAQVAQHKIAAGQTSAGEVERVL